MDIHARFPTIEERALSILLRSLPIKHGKHRILDIIRPTAKNSLNPNVRMGFAGQSITVSVNDLVGWHFMIVGSFDPEVSEVICAAATERETQVFWDIGANKGACSYQIAAALPAAKIVALEPQADLANLVSENFKLLCADRSEVHAVGVALQNEKLKLHVPSDNRGRASLLADGQRPNSTQSFVEVRTAASIVEGSQFGWPNLVKIDVEGYEPFVVESLSPAISSQFVRALVFENHPAQTDAFQKICGLVCPHGYSVFAITKTAFSTQLRSCDRPLSAANDYALIRNDVLATPAIRKLLA